MAAGSDALAAEQRALAAFLADLAPEDWDAASLCAGWSVADVVAHLVAWDELLVLRSTASYPVRLAGLASRALLTGGSTNRLNRRLLDRWRAATPDELLAAVARSAASPRRLFDRVAPDAHLAEHVVHHEDIRRGIGRRRAIPGDRLVRALDAVGRLPGVDARRRARGIRLVATDVEWSRGALGPEVRGPGDALLLALAGRAVVAAELTGPDDAIAQLAA